MNFVARLVSDNSGSLGKLGALSSLATPMEKILYGVLVHSYLCVGFDLPTSIKFSEINGFPKSGAQNPY